MALKTNHYEELALESIYLFMPFVTVDDAISNISLLLFSCRKQSRNRGNMIND